MLEPYREYNNPVPLTSIADVHDTGGITLRDLKNSTFLKCG
jgi:hypothetical protein